MARASLSNERAIIFLIGAVQFINILDFMIVMPLGPDFARALAIPSSQLGYIGGAYTASAAISGLAGSFFLDRFDRRTALVFSMAGLVIGTALGGFAKSFATLMIARIVAGAFGGPATSVAFSIIADTIPAQRRGRATGSVMGAFSVASVVGVPIGLEIARLGSWQSPFFAVAAAGLIITVMASLLLPSLSQHLHASKTVVRPALSALVRPDIMASYAMTAMVMCAGFIIIPNISGYIQANLHYPRSGIGGLYAVGGIVSFFATRFAGRVVDALGSWRTVAFGAVMLSGTIFIGFIMTPPPVPIAVIFMLFMLSMGFRNVAYNTLASKVPKPSERAQFMSMQSAVQHMASACGAFLSSRLLTEGDNHTLIGMAHVASVSIVLSLLLPFVVWKVERNVLAKASA